jgi:hypothetical protein
MNPKLLIAGSLVLAFVLGAMAPGIYNSTSRTFNSVDETAVAGPLQATPAVARTHFVQPRTVYVSNAAPVSTAVYQTHKTRTLKKEALIVGGSAGAGAAIGAVAGGKKGAGIGALSGGVAGLVYDLATRNK